MSGESRIDGLEMTAAHQARVIEELSEEIRRQWEAIEQLQKTVRGLRDAFQALEDGAGQRPEATKPPHY